MMTKIAKIIIENETSIKLDGLDLIDRRACVNSVKYFLPHARYSPAYKLGRWDGTTSFCTVGGRSYLNCLDKLLPVIIKAGYEFEIIDHRKTRNFEFDEIDENYLSHLNWPEGHRAANEPIILRDYQVQVINDCLNNFQGLCSSPTSSGKTIITSTLSKVVEKYGRTIVIVPNKNLVLQTEEDYKNIGLDVGVLFGDRKEYHRTHTICTWQSLMVLDKKNKDALDDDQLDVFLNNLVAVICDEVHIIKNLNVIHTLLTTVFANIPIRWGLTGTIPDIEYNEMSLVSAIGPIIGTLTAKNLQDDGYLANCHINILQTQEKVEYKTYQEELKYLVTDSNRLQWLAEKIQEVALTGNTLVLIDRIETGNKLNKLIPEATFISGKMKSIKRKEHYEDINLADGDIMIATYGTTSTGISINRIFNLFLIESGKSFTRVIQSIGRGLRMADDKSSVNIYDIGSKCKFSNRHLLKRIEYYKKVEYPYTRTKIVY